MKLESPESSALSASRNREFSGDGPQIEHLQTADRVFSSAGTGLRPIGANPVLVDDGTPSRVPRPGVEAVIEAVVSAIRTTLGRIDDVATELPTSRAHENVVVLFTDLVGWTGLASRMWPDVADDVRHRHFSLLRREILRWSGTEVKGLGDGAMAVFRTASAALSCAVAMQRDVDSDNIANCDPLGLRIGLSGGEVTREGSDYFGEPVIEAARLCASASGGEILATQIVKDLAGRRFQYPYRPLGRIELKGLPEPVAAFEVDWLTGCHSGPRHHGETVQISPASVSKVGWR